MLVEAYSRRIKGADKVCSEMSRGSRQSSRRRRSGGRVRQVFFNSSVAYLLNRALGEKHNVACPFALIGASNFFELAVAAAISLFGFNSAAALATVVGVLIEVPVMLLVVHVVNASKGWYERA
jgi:ACR3 family arsenite efflux pump ArsB